MFSASSRPSSIGAYLTSMGWVDEPILAAGQLRQGRAPSILGMAWGGGEDSSESKGATMRIRDERFPVCRRAPPGWP